MILYLTLFLVLSPAAILVPSLEELGLAQCSSVLRSSTFMWRELSSPGKSRLLMPRPPVAEKQSCARLRDILLPNLDLPKKTLSQMAWRLSLTTPSSEHFPSMRSHLPLQWK